MLVGKCLCGVVRYSVEGPFRYAGYCHCSRCRAGSGSTFSAFAGIEKDKLRVTDGDESITLFELNPDNIRSFCRLCGSQLFALVRDGQFFHVTMGTLVDDPGIRPKFPVRPDGACHQWRKVPPRELSVDLVADERLVWATGRVEAS